MTPQRKGAIPDAQLAALLTAKTTAAEAQEGYQQAVADALKAGGSVREVHRVTGLSTSTVQTWGRDRGWPTREQQEAWAENRGQRDEWEARLKTAQAMTMGDDE